MSAVLNFQLAMKRVECADCGMSFAMSETFIKERRDDHQSFFCPRGHSNYFPGKSEAERLKDQLAQKERETEWYRVRGDRALTEAATLGHQLRAVKGVVTKTKKKLGRVDNGVCTECNRTFSNVARHMQSKHGVECNEPPKGSRVRGGS